MSATLIAQLSDPHIQSGPGDRDSAAGLAAGVEAVLSLRARPDAVIVTGDLVNGPGAAEYERVRELLAPLPMPVHVIPGNHDDPAAMHEHFPLADGPGAGEPYRWAAAVGGLRLIGCDTSLPGSDAGRLDAEHREWLERELAAEPGMPSLVAMHHPPLETGLRALDVICLPDADRDALARMLAASPQVRRVISGHVHRAAFAVLGGCGILTCPSTYLQAPLEIPGDELELVAETPAFALHALLGSALTSHIQTIEG